MKRVHSIAALSLAVSIGAVGSAFAYHGGDSILRFGASYMSPADDTYTLKGTTTTKVKYKQKEDTQFGINYTYMLNENFGLEAALSTKFTHEVKNKNTGNNSFEYEHMPLIFGGQWYPMGGQSTFQPYLSLGLHYDWFDKAKSKDTSITKVSFDDSWGWNAGAGFDWMITDAFLINASLRYLSLEPDVKFTQAAGLSKAKEFKINPWMWNLNIGIKF